MPSLEVAAMGGGTNLEPQRSILASMIGQEAGLNPGDKSRRLASVIASTVLAGELSLMSSLVKGTVRKITLTYIEVLDHVTIRELYKRRFSREPYETK